MGVAGHNPLPSKRGEIDGWSPGAVRRHTRWLYSIDAPALELEGEVGFAATLTLRHCPPDHEAWFRVRERWLKRLRALGVVRVHWVVEWQARGVPHLHAAVYFPSADHVPIAELGGMPVDPGFAVLQHWVAAAREFGATFAGQHVDRISGVTGWLKYLSKHASRGVKHYQRTGKPAGWKKTGRLWGHTGAWPVMPPVEVDLTMPEFHRYRRLVRAWRIADARASGDLVRLRFARRMLACPDRRLGSVRGVSDWVPESVSLQLMAIAAAD